MGRTAKCGQQRLEVDGQGAMMIVATRPYEKRALAAALEQYDKGTLGAIKQLSGALGGTRAVYYENDDRAKNDLIFAAFKRATQHQEGTKSHRHS